MFIAALFGKGQKVETTHMSYDRTMSTPWDTIPLSEGEEQTTDTTTWIRLQRTLQSEESVPEGDVLHGPSNNILEMTE